MSRTYIYSHRKFLLSPAEHILYDVLIKHFGHKCYIFPQIHLDKVVWYKNKGQNWKGAWKHIDEKSVDFVLCDRRYISPILVIELDDKTHDKPDRQLRDQEVERIFKEINVPLLRISNDGDLKKSSIIDQISNKLQYPSV